MSSISSGNFSQIAGSYADTAAVYSKPETTKTDETSGKKKVSGQTIGNPKLSEKASKYYEQLKKKYSKEHIYILTFIYYFKNILSISDIQKMLNPLTEKFFDEGSKPDLDYIYKEIFSENHSSFEYVHT